MGVLLTGITTLWNFSTFSDKLEQSTIDFRYRYFNPRLPISDQVILVDIDEQSFRLLGPRFGRWPWPRSVYKDLIEFMMLGEPSLILYDMLFTEADANKESDAQLAEVTATTGKVSHAMQFLPTSSWEDKKHIPLEAVALSKLLAPLEKEAQLLAPPAAQPWPRWPSGLLFNDFLTPYAQLIEKTPILHIVNTAKDEDGILRRMPLVIPYDGHYLPSLSLRALLARLKKPALSWGNQESLKILDEGKPVHEIPLTATGMYSLHFYAKDQEPITYRFSELVQSADRLQKGEVTDPAQLSVNPLTFQGKTILIGASATGLQDLKSTPVSENQPGVFLHTTLISNVLQNHYVKNISVQWTLLIVALLIFSSYAAVFYLKNLVLRSLIPLVLPSLYCLSAFWLFQKQSLLLPMGTPALASLFCLLDAFTYMSFIEGRDRRRISGTLSKYLSPTVTQHLVENGIDPTVEVGQAQELTILFSDVRGFTNMSETMEPAQVVQILNRYLGRMTEIVFEHQGTLDKFIGDAVMAFWGAPLKDAQHPERAVETALHMIQSLEVLNEEFKIKNWPTLKIGIGLNTGKVIVGNIGSDRRLDYTVIGDTVNLTSRLESLTKYYRVPILVGDPTYQKTQDLYVYRVLDLVQVKGKNQAVKIWEPLIRKPKAQAVHFKKAELFEEAWRLYEQGDFAAAFSQFQKIKMEFTEDGPTDLYLARCEELMADPPSEWKGIYVAKEK